MGGTHTLVVAVLIDFPTREMCWLIDLDGGGQRFAFLGVDVHFTGIALGRGHFHKFGFTLADAHLLQFGGIFFEDEAL